MFGVIVNNFINSNVHYKYKVHMSKASTMDINNILKLRMNSIIL